MTDQQRRRLRAIAEADQIRSELRDLMGDGAEPLIARSAGILRHFMGQTSFGPLEAAAFLAYAMERTGECKAVEMAVLMAVAQVAAVDILEEQEVANG